MPDDPQTVHLMAMKIVESSPDWFAVVEKLNSEISGVPLGPRFPRAEAKRSLIADVEDQLAATASMLHEFGGAFSMVLRHRDEPIEYSIEMAEEE